MRKLSQVGRGADASRMERLRQAIGLAEELYMLLVGLGLPKDGSWMEFDTDNIIFTLKQELRSAEAASRGGFTQKC